jgi:hypothetical protein
MNIHETQSAAEDPQPVKPNGRAGKDEFAAPPPPLPKPPKAPRSLVDDFGKDPFAAPAPTAPPKKKAKGGAVTIGKPKADMFFQPHPDPEMRGFYFIIPSTFGSSRPSLLIHPDVAAVHPAICKRVMLVLCATADRNFFLWPIPQQDRFGNLNDWHRSAMEELEDSFGKWTRLEAKERNYESSDVEDEDKPADPEWPTKSFPQIVREAFVDHIIERLDDPRLLKIVGRKRASKGTAPVTETPEETSEA